MDNIRNLFADGPLKESSVVAIEINSYMRHWNKVAFMARDKNGIASQDFIPIKSSEFLEQQLYLAAGLLELNVEKGESVAVFSPNSMRYAISIFALFSIGAVFVPIYPTTTEDEAEYLIRHSNSRILFVGDIPQYQKAISILNKVKSPLKKIVTTFKRNDEIRDHNVLSYEELIEIGKKSKRIGEVAAILSALSEQQTAALIYTPGTTGVPKGVLLSHGNFICQRALVDIFKVSDKDVRLAHLPFSHIFGLSADLFSCAAAGSLMYITKTFETEEILQNITDIRPTIMCSVPRMYEKICINIIHQINHLKGIKKTVFSLAIKIGRTCYRCTSTGKPVSPFLRFFNLLFAPVLGQLRRSIGMNRIRILFSGGGPLPQEIAYFFGGLGLPIIEGYGLTETGPIINVNRPEKNKPGTVGPPLENVSEKISDEGEIIVKGPMVFQGYFKNDEENEGAFTPDGYFKTGDIGIFDDDSHLMITGRIKDLIITSAGKNVAPLYIEKKFEADEMISYICVVGDKRKYLSALVVPNFQLLRKFARERNLRFNSDEELILLPDVINLYKTRINTISNTLAKYEQIKKFTLLPHEFSAKTGELSPTFKFRRHFVHEKYKDIIDKMYPSGDSIADDL